MRVSQVNSKPDTQARLARGRRGHESRRRLSARHSAAGSARQRRSAIRRNRARRRAFSLNPSGPHHAAATSSPQLNFKIPHSTKKRIKQLAVRDNITLLTMLDRMLELYEREHGKLAEMRTPARASCRAATGAVRFRPDDERSSPSRECRCAPSRSSSASATGGGLHDDE